MTHFPNIGGDMCPNSQDWPCGLLVGRSSWCHQPQGQGMLLASFNLFSPSLVSWHTCNLTDWVLWSLKEMQHLINSVWSSSVAYGRQGMLLSSFHSLPSFVSWYTCNLTHWVLSDLKEMKHPINHYEALQLLASYNIETLISWDHYFISLYSKQSICVIGLTIVNARICNTKSY